MRSLVSLGSSRSHSYGSTASVRSNGNPETPATGDDLQRKTREKSSSSDSSSANQGAHYLAYPEGNSVETYAIADRSEKEVDLEHGVSVASPFIQVGHSFQLSEEQSPR